MTINIIVDEINLFEYSTTSIQRFLEELQVDLLEGRLISPNWSRKKEPVRKFLASSFKNPVFIIKESGTQEGVWIINLILPIVETTYSVYIRTSSVPIFISKNEIGPEFLLDEIENIMKRLRSSFKEHSLNEITIKKEK